MNFKSYSYEISVYIKFTKSEFDLLWVAFDSCSETRRYREQGEFMYGNKNRQRWRSDLHFTWSQLDKSLKALEIASIDTSKRNEFNELYGKIYKLMEQVSDEHKRILKTPTEKYKELRKNEVISALTKEDLVKFSKIV